MLWGLLACSFLGTVLLPPFRNEYYTGENLSALQARAFWHGRLGLSEPHSDTAFIGGEYHLVNPAFPALVFFPFVVVLPEEADEAISLIVALALTAAAAYAFRGILVKANTGFQGRRWCGMVLAWRGPGLSKDPPQDRRWPRLAGVQTHGDGKIPAPG